MSEPAENVVEYIRTKLPIIFDDKSVSTKVTEQRLNSIKEDIDLLLDMLRS